MRSAMRVVDINPSGVPPAVDALVVDAWVIDGRARSEDPARYEAMDLASQDRTRRLRPCLVAMPGPLDELERRLADHRRAGAPAVIRICPGAQGHGYPLESWALSPLPEFAEREELALIVDYGAAEGGYPWSEVVKFARDYPRLPIAALGAPLDGPTAARALDATPNLILETSAFIGKAGSGLSDLVRACGAYRFAHGSGGARAPVSALVEAIEAGDAEIVLAGTADHLANGTWGSTYL